MKRIPLFLFLVLCVSCKSNVPPAEDAGNTPMMTVENVQKVDSNSKAERPLALPAIEKTEQGPVNDFAFRLMRRLLPQPGKVENTVLSPVSVAYAMGMLMTGADGDARTEIEQVMGASSDQTNNLFHRMMVVGERKDTAVRMTTANLVAVNHKYQLKQDYADSIKTIYSGQVWPLDFSSPSAQKAIDDWCADHTNGLIPSMPLQLSDDMMAVLANAVYFKGGWTHRFYTMTDDRFTNADGKGVRVKMMTTERHIGYVKRTHYAMARLDYGNRKYSMVVVLPDKGQTTGQILGSLTARQWSKDLSDMCPVQLFLGMPRFEVNNTHDLRKRLEQLGIHSVFDTGKAPLGKMFKNTAAISKVMQKARIKVDDEGTEAAAVTYMAAIGAANIDSEPEPVIEFYANRPFLYAITDNDTHALLFLGEYRGEQDAPAMNAAIYKEGERERLAEQRHSEWAERYKHDTETVDPQRCYDVVDVMPEFPYNGQTGLMDFIQRNINYPAKARRDSLQGRVIVTFIVETDGSLSNFKIVRPLSPELNAEALRVCRLMPKWKPGRMNYQAVRVKYTIPVRFKL